MLGFAGAAFVVRNRIVVTGEDPAGIAMIAVGIDMIVEFGASPVLAPMMKRVEGAPKAMHVGDVAGVEKLRALLADGGTS